MFLRAANSSLAAAQVARGVRHDRLQLRPADYTERRPTGCLLIWRDLPHWMVVDPDFHAFLQRFDGQRTVADALSGSSSAEMDEDALCDTVSHLVSIGVLRGELRQPSRRAAPARTPSLIENVAVNLTRACNLRCRLCYNLDNLHGTTHGELTHREIITFLKQLKGFLVEKPSLFLMGGEPLLCPDKALAVSSFAARAGFQVLISTNGTQITEQFARWARRIGIQVQVSIDGHRADLNDAVRGRGSYAKAAEGLRILVSSGVHSILSMVCHAGNLLHIESFYRFAKSMKVNEARVIPLKRMGGALGGRIAPAPVSRIVAEMVSMLRAHPEYSELMGRDCLSILAASCAAAVRRTSCGTGLQTLLLDSDGGIYPCLNTCMADFRVANIRDGGFDFGRVWRSSPVLNSVRKQTSVEVPGNACSKCLVRYWCLGGCRGETVATGGTLGSRSCACKDLRNATRAAEPNR